MFRTNCLRKNNLNVKTSLINPNDLKYSLKNYGFALIVLESPWKYYEKLYKLQFGDSEYIIVAERINSSSDDCLSYIVIRSFLGYSILDNIRSI